MDMGRRAEKHKELVKNQKMDKRVRVYRHRLKMLEKELEQIRNGNYANVKRTELFYALQPSPLNTLYH